MPRRTIEQSPAYTLARSRLASRHQQLAEPDKSALGNGNLRKGHEAGQDGTIRRKARNRNYRLAKPSSERPKVSGSPHQARDAKVDGETPPAAFEARRAHGGTPAPCRRTSPI
ncbi:hypothetical protein quinque_002358 [Culex quinquefasciatus]